MAVETFEGCLEMLCDDCGEPYVDFVSDSKFHDMLQEAQADGWRVQRGPRGWEHTCPNCLESETLRGF